MNLLGIHLTVLIGATLPMPAPIFIMEALQSVEVTHNDTERSGFKMEFAMNSGKDTKKILKKLAPFSRIILMPSFNLKPRVLMDGIVARHEITPGSEPGASNLTIFGEDVSIMMDLEEKQEAHKGMDDATIAKNIIGKYTAKYGLTPKVEAPKKKSKPGANDPPPMQTGTDLEHLKKMAERYGFVFYVSFGKMPKKNEAYWGPPKSGGKTQKALTVNMGPNSNVDDIRFSYDATAPTKVSGWALEKGALKPVKAEKSSQKNKLAKKSALDSQSQVRLKLLLCQSGLDVNQATARAQGMIDASLQEAVRAEGALDALRYGDILNPRELVDLRGGGESYNGTWRVKSVTHQIKPGEYKQRFTLTREGLGAKSSKVQT